MRIMHPGMAPLTLAGLVAGCLAMGPARAEAPKTVVSIPPLHSLVAGVMAGVGAPQLLIRGGRSPHDIALRPSDIRRLKAASLVVWVGPGLESFLVRPIAGLKRSAVLTLFDAPDMRALPRRAGGAWEEDAHHPELTGSTSIPHGLSPNYADPHIWLSPDNARAIVRAVAGRLRLRDPADAAAYSANEERLLQRIAALDLEVSATLAPVRRVPYIVFHDAYQYFERHYELSAAGAIAASPERLPSAHRLIEIRRRIMESGAACIFREPQFPPRLISTITAGTNVRVGVLDPLGADIRPGPDLWFTLMRRLGGALATCLKPDR